MLQLLGAAGEFWPAWIALQMTGFGCGSLCAKRRTNTEKKHPPARFWRLRAKCLSFNPCRSSSKKGFFVKNGVDTN
jgi:hypothetical protein